VAGWHACGHEQTTLSGRRSVAPDHLPVTEHRDDRGKVLSRPSSHFTHGNEDCVRRRDRGLRYFYELLTTEGKYLWKL
jgi:hypothetical protein